MLCFAFHHIRASYKIFKKLKIPAEEVYRAISGDVVYFASGTRVEIYTSSDISNEILSFFSRKSGIPQEMLRNLFSFISDRQAIEHLFRLTCKIESRVLGETYLPWKIERALNFAQKLGRAGELKSIFRHALDTWEEVRKKTRIEGSFEHVEIASKLLDEVERGVLLGAGLSGIVLTKKLSETAEIHAIHRDEELSAYAAERSGAKPAPYSQLGQHLQKGDLLICSTLASHYRVTPEMLRGVKIKVVDISPFDNVHPGVGELPGVEIINGKVKQAKREHMQIMREAVGDVERIIEREMAKYD